MNNERDLGYEASAATQRLNDMGLWVFLTMTFKVTLLSSFELLAGLLLYSIPKATGTDS